MLFIIFLLAPITNWVGEKKLRIVLSILLLWVLSLVIKVDYFCLNRVIYYYSFFLVGYWIKNGIQFDKCINIELYKKYLCAIVFTVVYIFLINTKRTEWSDWIVALLGCLVALEIALIISRTKTIKWFIIKAGNYSLQFYLLNGYLLVVSRVLFVQIWGLTNPYLIYVSVVISNCIGATVVSEVLKRTKYLKFLFGM